MDKKNKVLLDLTRHDYQLLIESGSSYAELQGQMVNHETWKKIMNYLQKLNMKYWKKHSKQHIAYVEQNVSEFGQAL